MAEISTSGLEELLSDMEAIAEIPDATILEMLSAEAGVIAEAQAAEARAMGVVDKGVTARSSRGKRRAPLRRGRFEYREIRALLDYPRRYPV